VISQELNTYPLLLSPEGRSEGAGHRYVEYKGSFGLEATFWRLLVTPS